MQHRLYLETEQSRVVQHPTEPLAANLGSFLAGAGQAGLVSAIIPAFNREGLVADALGSLAAQSYGAIQIIVVDDGSTDATAAVVLEWMRTHPDHWVDLVRQPNRGVSAARNVGLDRALGEFIYFLDSDDVSEPFTIELLIAALHEAPNKPFALGRVCNSDVEGNVIAEDYSGITHMRSADLLRNHWLLFAALYRRSALRRSGSFNETLKMGEDTEFNWRVIVVNGVGILCDRVLGQRRHHNHGHLYLDSHSTAKMRGSLLMHRALGDWLNAHPEYARRMSARGLVATHNYYHREGLAEGEELWGQVAQLFDHLSPKTRFLNALLRFSTRQKVRPFYWFGYRSYRKARVLLRPIKHAARRLVGR